MNAPKKLTAILLAAVLVLACIPGFAAVAATENPYRDVSDTFWAKDAILRWSELGVVQGSGGLFRPDDPITRAELATILNRVAGFPETADRLFSDTAGKWYEEHVNRAAMQGVYLVPNGAAEGDSCSLARKPYRCSIAFSR